MKFSLIQWNIWYKEPIENIAKFLLKNPVDIICLQELTLDWKYQKHPNTLKFLAEQLGYNYAAIRLPIVDSNEGVKTIVNAVFTRFPIENINKVLIQEPKRASKDYANQHRGYVEARVTLPNGQSLEVATTHMSYTNRFVNNALKKAEADNLFKAIGQHQSRFVFAGDLNSRPNSYTIMGLKKYLKHAGPNMLEKTWTTKPFEYGGFKEDKLNWRLDYVFTTSDINVTKAEILKTQYSDHLPVRVELEV